MRIFLEGDRVMDKHGKCGTVVDGWGVWRITVKWDDGTTTNVHTFFLEKLKATTKGDN